MRFFLILFTLISSANALEPTSDLATLKARLSGKRVGGHQGGIFNYAPNTLAAFDYSYRVGADIVEMDLRLSKDGQVVVYHDEKLSLWTECQGRVQDHSLAELKACIFRNSPGSQIPTFEEVLQWAAGKIIVNAEFKVAEVIPAAMALVRKYNAAGWIYFQTQSDRDKLKLALQTDAGIGLLFSTHNQEEVNWILSQNIPSVLIIEVDEGSHSAEIISQIHSVGKMVSEDTWHYTRMWEIFGSDCREAFTVGIDIGISNRPDDCVRERNKLN